MTFNEDVKKAVEALQNGGLILYPTDTVWGIGCDATNEEAVQKIFDIKKRSVNKPMMVLLHNENMLDRYVVEVPDIAWQLIDVTDKPLTIIYPNAKNLAKNLIAPDGSVGVRLVNDKFCSALLQQFKKPIVSTSANISGQAVASIFKEISNEIKSGVNYIVSYKQDSTQHSSPSSIIKIGLGGEIEILRK